MYENVVWSIALCSMVQQILLGITESEAYQTKCLVLPSNVFDNSVSH